MRDATAAEQKLIRKGVCPFCRSERWLEGPHGGLAVNIYCENCGAGLNITGIFTPEIIKEPGPLPIHEAAPSRVPTGSQSTVRRSFGRLISTLRRSD